MSSPTTPTRSSSGAISPDRSPSRNYVIPRDGDRDLAFTGWLIGEACADRDGELRGLCVRIYATESEALVLDVYRWRPTSAEGQLDDQRRVEVAWDAEEALDWLKEDSGGSLGALGKAAWTSACRNWSSLADEEFERVD